MSETIKLDRIEDAIADFATGKMVIVVDDEDRENEGDLIIAGAGELHAPQCARRFVRADDHRPLP